MYRWANLDRALLTNPRALRQAIVRGLRAHWGLPLYRNGYALLLSGAGTSAIGLAYWALATRLYPAEVVGLNSAILSAMLLLSGVAQLGISYVLVRFIPTAGNQTRRLIVYGYLVSVSAAALLGLVFIAGVEVWAPALWILRRDSTWSCIFMLAIIAWCLFGLQDSVLTGLRQAMWVPVENIVFAIAKIAILAGSVIRIQQMGIFVSWAAPVLFLLVPVNLLIFRRLIPMRIAEAASNAEPVDRPSIVRFLIGNQIGAMFALIYINVLPILVASRINSEANAYFYLPWTISNSLQLIATNMTISLTVEGARDRLQLSGYCRRVLKQEIRLLAPLVFTIVIGAPWFLHLFGRNYALEGASLLRWLAIAALPDALIILALGVARVQNRPGLVVIIQASVCLFVLPGSYFLLPTYGILAIGWMWFASQAIVATVLLATVLRPILLPPA